MKIWIDLANSPHVTFFYPIYQKLVEQGHQVFFTYRDLAQTLPLVNHFGLSGQQIGRHGGKNLFGKAWNLLERTTQLYSYARQHQFDLAVSHNSYPQTIAARFASIPSIAITDYEGHLGSHFSFRAATKVIVPKAFPDDRLLAYGAKPEKIVKYHGFKEQVYLAHQQPQPEFLAVLAEACHTSLEQIQQKILVIVRPPPIMALYHRFHNDVFPHLLNKLNAQADSVFTLMLPRHKEQGIELAKEYPNLFFSDRALDGVQLVLAADLLFSAGGTMNREAAIVGTPAYTLFAGKLPAVDQALIDQKKLKQIIQIEQINQLNFTKKSSNDALVNTSLLQFIVNELITTTKNCC